MKLFEIIKDAKGILIKNWKKALFITIIYLGITFCISSIIGNFEEGTIIRNILSVLQFVIIIPLNFGLEWTFLNLKRNKSVKILDFLKTGIYKFFRAWKITISTLLKMIIPMLAIIIGTLLYNIIASYSIMQAEEGNTTIAQWGLIVALGIYIIPIIYAMFVLLKYSLISFIAHDKPEANAFEIVNESQKLMKKNRWKIIFVQLPYFLWLILDSFIISIETSYIEIIVYIIGYIILFPYTQVALTCFYEKLVKLEEA